MPPLATPLLIPRAVPSPLPDDLRLSIKAHLVRENSIPDILNALNTECARVGWEEKLRARVLQLLRGGGFESRGELVGRIVGEARGLVDEGGEEGSGDGAGRKGEKREGMEGGEKVVDVRVPDKAVVEGAKVVRGVLEKVGELEPEGRDWWDT